MTELRWILLVVGALVVAGVYLVSRRGDGAPAAPSSPERVAPTLDAEGEADTVAYSESTADRLFGAGPVAAPLSVTASQASDEPVSGDQLSIPMPDDDSHDVEPVVSPDRIIRLHVVARDDTPFLAADIVGALRAEGLRFAHHDVFHRFETEGNPGPDEPSLFSVTDMLKPGTFDLSTLADKRLKGVTLLMALPNPGDAVAVFAEMLATGRRLAATFSGLLVDAQGCAISRQSASHMREDIINYQLEARRHDDRAE